MATVTETTLQETSILRTITDENKTKKSIIHTKYQNKHNDCDIYDPLIPKNDLKLMKSVRKWEKDVMGFQTPLRWINVVVISVYHIVTLWWYIDFLMHGKAKWQTIAFAYLMGACAGFGVTGGAHRYWCHRSYKASKPLQVFLLFCYSIAGQNTVYEWVRDHRVHHKFSETSADPHDANRGFFFSHVGWLMMKKHPAVVREGNKLDMSDVTEDPMLRFHTKYFKVFKLLFCFILPTLVPVYAWGESWNNAIGSQILMRYILTVNFTWAVNSFAHLWGNKPYDKNIMPAENWMVSFVAMGEGWHNYHHTFPWDYKAAELAYSFNLTTLALDGFQKIGWAYDMKTASPKLIKEMRTNKGE